MILFLPGVEWIRHKCRQVTVTEKALMLFSIPLIFLLVVFFLLVQVQHINETEQESFWQAQESANHTENLVKSMADADNYLQLFFITHDPDFLPVYAHAVSDVKDAVKQLKAHFWENPGEQRLVRRIDTQVAQKLDYYTKVEKLINDADNDQAAKLIRNNSSIGRFVGLRLDIQSLLQEEMSADARRQVHLIQSYQTLSWQLGMAVPVAILFTLLGALQYNRWVTDRIGALTEKAQQTVKGKDFSLFNTTGNDEISNLARAISKLGQAALKNEDNVAALEGVSDVVTSISAEGRFNKVSRASMKLWGYSPAELMEKNFLDLVISDDFAATRLWMTKIMSGSTEINFENGLRHKDGSIVYCQWFAYYSQQDQQISAVAHDITARRLAEQRQAVQYAVTTILAESEELSNDISDILQSICETTGWSLGAFWTVEQEDHLLHCVDVWHKSDVNVNEFVNATRDAARECGAGLPGRVWQTGQSAWIPDIGRDPDYPRAAIAIKEGLHAAIAVPLILHGEVLAVMEFFSSEIRLPDDGLIQMLATIGGLIGQFMQRKRLEKAAG